MDDNYNNGFGNIPFGDGGEGYGDMNGVGASDADNAQPVDFESISDCGGIKPDFNSFADGGDAKSEYYSASRNTFNGTDGSYNFGGNAPTTPYPEMNGGKRKKEKKPPTKKTLVAFGIVTLVLCLVMSGISGAISSYVTVSVINARENAQGTTTQGKDELISVPTDGNEAPAGAEVTAPELNEPTTEKTAPSSSSGEKTKGEVYADSVNSIVGIKVEGEKEVETFFGRTAKATFTSTGSGFFVTSDGYIVTNYHVVENATKITVTTYAGQAYEAIVRGYEASNDIAVIKAEGSFTPVSMGDSSSLAVGDDILVIGNPLGELSYTFTDGVVSYLNRAVTTDSGNAINMFQTNAAINEGNSGGPVYDMYGKVVGIASAKYAASSVEGLGFFIPINDIKTMVDDIIKNGYVSGKPSLGVSVQPVTQTMSLRYSIPVGLYIVAVGSDTAAASAGLKAADVITAIDGTSISGVAELSSFLSSKRAGDTVTVTVSRSGQKKSFALTLDEYKPADARTEYSGVYDY